MQATATVLKSVFARLKIREGRLAALKSAVSAVVVAGKVQLTALGRALGNSTSAKHNIKRIDRLIGNQHLQTELVEVYRSLCVAVLGKAKRPVLLVDWSDVGRHASALVCSVALEGRAVTVYGEVHARDLNANAKVERNFLERLKCVLPAGCAPVIVTDAGFRSPWFQAVAELGWHFLGRLRNNVQVAPLASPSNWYRLRKLFNSAVKRPTSWGKYFIGKTRNVFSGAVQIVTVADRPFRNTSRRNPKKATAKTKDAVKSAREPWVLATSLELPAKQIVRLYKKRMQIEQTFRDFKDCRFGWAMTYTPSKKPERLSVLLLIAALAHYATVLVGAHAEACELHKSYQANTRRSRVLSLARLGRLVLGDLLHREWLTGLPRIAHPLKIAQICGDP